MKNFIYLLKIGKLASILSLVSTAVADPLPYSVLDLVLSAFYKDLSKTMEPTKSSKFLKDLSLGTKFTLKGNLSEFQDGIALSPISLGLSLILLNKLSTSTQEAITTILSDSSIIEFTPWSPNDEYILKMLVGGGKNTLQEFIGGDMNLIGSNIQKALDKFDVTDILCDLENKLKEASNAQPQSDPKAVTEEEKNEALAKLLMEKTLLDLKDSSNNESSHLNTNPKSTHKIEINKKENKEDLLAKLQPFFEQGTEILEKQAEKELLSKILPSKTASQMTDEEKTKARLVEVKNFYGIVDQIRTSLPTNSSSNSAEDFFKKISFNEKAILRFKVDHEGNGKAYSQILKALATNCASNFEGTIQIRSTGLKKGTLASEIASDSDEDLELKVPLKNIADTVIGNFIEGLLPEKQKNIIISFRGFRMVTVNENEKPVNIFDFFPPDCQHFTFEDAWPPARIVTLFAETASKKKETLFLALQNLEPATQISTFHYWKDNVINAFKKQTDSEKPTQPPSIEDPFKTLVANAKNTELSKENVEKDVMKKVYGHLHVTFCNDPEFPETSNHISTLQELQEKFKNVGVRFTYDFSATNGLTYRSDEESWNPWPK